MFLEVFLDLLQICSLLNSFQFFRYCFCSYFSLFNHVKPMYLKESDCLTQALGIFCLRTLGVYISSHGVWVHTFIFHCEPIFTAVFSPKHTPPGNSYMPYVVKVSFQGGFVLVSLSSHVLSLWDQI